MLDCKLDRHILLIGAEMFNICTFFVRCSSSKSSNSDEWKARTWNSGQIFEIEVLMVGQYHSEWWFSDNSFLNWMSKLVQTVMSKLVQTAARHRHWTEQVISENSWLSGGEIAAYSRPYFSIQTTVCAVSNTTWKQWPHEHKTLKAAPLLQLLLPSE